MKSVSRTAMRPLIATGMLALSALGLFAVAAAQEAPTQVGDVESRKRKISLIQDETRLFTGATLASLMLELQQFAKEVGWPLLITTSSYIPGGQDVRALAANYRKDLVGDRLATVMYVDRGTGNISFSAAPGIWSIYPISAYPEILRGCLEAVRAEPSSSERRALAAARAFMRQMRELHQATHHTRRLVQTDWPMLPVILAGALGLVAILLLLLDAHHFRKLMRLRTHYYLPNVVMGLRLGAPFGGGVMGFPSAIQRAPASEPVSAKSAAAPSAPGQTP